MIYQSSNLKLRILFFILNFPGTKSQERMTNGKKRWEKQRTFQISVLRRKFPLGVVRSFIHSLDIYYFIGVC